MERQLMPADTYIVLNKTILTDYDRKLLITLYQPIIGAVAVSLYLTLWSYLNKNDLSSNEWTHHHLMTSMGFKLSIILEARNKLEAIGLLKTYYKEDNINNYLYLLYSPLKPNEFFKNPILDNALYSNVGSFEYQNIINYFKKSRIDLSDYTDITVKFSDVFLTYENKDVQEEEVLAVSQNELNFTPKFDINLVLDLVPEEVLRHSSITKGLKNYLNQIVFAYDLDQDAISNIIRSSINVKHMIDKEQIKENAINYYTFEHDGKLPTLIYKKQPDYLKKPAGDISNKAKAIYQFENISPYNFLLAKYKGSPLTKNDKEILSMLIINFNLQPGVINVLIDYVLKINNNKLTYKFIEAIASQWRLAKIETVEQAMSIAEKEYKKKKTIKTSKNFTKPEWFDKDLNISLATSKEQEEIDKMLADLK